MHRLHQDEQILRENKKSRRIVEEYPSYGPCSSLHRVKILFSRRSSSNEAAFIIHCLHQQAA
jgi:hypothetical protein